jgi:hypothetical protein
MCYLSIVPLLLLRISGLLLGSQNDRGCEVRAHKFPMFLIVQAFLALFCNYSAARPPLPPSSVF